MRLTKVKVYKDLSAETLAFSATLVIDKAKYAVTNAGQGGCHSYWPPLRQEHREQMKAQLVAQGDTALLDFEPEDALIDSLLHEYELRSLCRKGKRVGATVVVDFVKPYDELVGLWETVGALRVSSVYATDLPRLNATVSDMVKRHGLETATHYSVYTLDGLAQSRTPLPE